MTAEVVKIEEAKAKVYSSIDEMMHDGGGEIEYDEVPGFKEGSVIRIGSVTAGDMVEWSNDNEDPKKKRVAGLRLICKSVCTGADSKPPNYRYLADPHLIEANIKKLLPLRHKETERVVRAIVKLNGMSIKDEEKAKND